MKWPFARATREPGWLVVSLRPTEISFVHGQYAPGGASLVDRCGTRALDAEDSGVERLAKELGFDRYQCSTLLAPGDYQMLLVDAPNVPTAELKTAIRWRIKDLLDYRVDDATVDVLEVPRNPAGGERGHSMYAVTARNDVIQSCIGRFEAAHIPLTVIDIEETAQRNVAALFERDERGLALLHLGEEQGLLTINYRQELVLARRIEAGMRALLAEGGATREEQLQRILLELQRTFDHFDRQFAYVPVSKLMLAPGPADSGLLEFLAANLDMPVERVHLSSAIAFGARAELEPEEEWRLFHLIGASLRHEAKAL
ncbi:MAG TPA: agglutinin biogenesis protein MshI [Burkholderiales bacterium]|jgi:MSHA biogenesis protein MshI|nr:agglutinin biogenesis protein MshI [Burkholderiales bacterium]